VRPRRLEPTGRDKVGEAAFTGCNIGLASGVHVHSLGELGLRSQGSREVPSFVTGPTREGEGPSRQGNEGTHRGRTGGGAGAAAGAGGGDLHVGAGLAPCNN